MKIAIIKADDVRGPTKAWDAFFAVSKEKGVKVSAGIICNSLAKKEKKYVKWLKAHQESGQVEFWNHGWDHKQDRKTRVQEFKGSGYDHQKRHFDDSQAIMKDVLGAAPLAFGTPYNGLDADTVKVMNENAEMRLFFGYKAANLKDKVLVPMALRGENDGTGKPNFAKFKADYAKKKDVAFTALQFHPGGFGKKQLEEYGKILDFLKSEGWTFMLPSEYVKKMEDGKK